MVNTRPMSQQFVRMAIWQLLSTAVVVQLGEVEIAQLGLFFFSPTGGLNIPFPSP